VQLLAKMGAFGAKVQYAICPQSRRDGRNARSLQVHYQIRYELHRYCKNGINFACFYDRQR
jgi:hypothetical protein